MESNEKTEGNIKKKQTGFIILFIVVMLTSLIIKEKGLHIFNEGNKKLKLSKELNIILEDKSQVKLYDEGFTISNDKYITNYNLDGEKTWSEAISYKNGLALLGKNNTYLGDLESGKIVAINNKGEKIWTYETHNPIHMITNRKDYLIIFSKINRDIRKVHIINQDGKEIFSRQESKKEFLAANVSPNGKGFAVSSIDLDKVVLKGVVTYFREDNSNSLEKEFERETVYDILFINNNKILLIMEKRLVCIDDEGNIIWKKNLSNSIRDLAVLKNNNIAILYDEDTSKLEILHAEGDTEYKKSFKSQYKDIITDENKIFLVGEKNITGINKNNIFLEYRSREKIKKVDKIDEKVFIFDEQKVKIMDIVNR
ncbi:hypothetical protein CLPU_23c00110 [Gottschalkia purinilytica]|uniref:PQQ-like domain-containing protein n=1 Tax=Gottschalkia purinilytica TaxID=1503 RepID=A0A0L0W6J4_GOTPU|nr:DUF5711 family protein [Gottschalkia purinilytica]KNF07128.1 hypothetical protein CLPU_23c00110 [Gottschalkia purinilytica]